MQQKPYLLILCLMLISPSHNIYPMDFTNLLGGAVTGASALGGATLSFFSLMTFCDIADGRGIEIEKCNSKGYNALLHFWGAPKPLLSFLEQNDPETVTKHYKKQLSATANAALTAGLSVPTTIVLAWVSLKLLYRGLGLAYLVETFATKTSPQYPYGRSDQQLPDEDLN